MNSDPAAPAYAFDDLVLDCRTLSVSKGAERRHLTPRAFDVLRHLVESSGRVVERRELFERFWGGSHVTDNALTRVIKEIRRAIGDDADAPRYIETVPRRGFRFICAVAPASADTSRQSIAILPFRTETSAEDAVSLGQGLATGIIESLAGCAGLRVIGRTSAFMHAAQGTFSPQRAGADLHVATTCSGSLAVDGGRLLLHAVLNRTSDGTVLWSERYERPLDDAALLQATIARDIVARLGVRATDQDINRFASAPTTSPEAFRLYSKGYYSLYKFTPDGLTKSFDYFRQAIACDPEYGRAYAGLVEAYFNLSFFAPPTDVWPPAKEAALKALQLDPTLAEAHYAFALISVCYDRDWRTAEAAFLRAIALKPNYSLAHEWYGWSVLAQAGRAAEATAQFEHALQLDPVSLATMTDYGFSLYWSGQLDAAESTLRQVIDLEDRLYVAHVGLGLTLLRAGRPEDGIAHLRRADELSGNPVAAGFLGHALATAGHREEARAILARLADQSTTGYVPPDAPAVVHIALGEHDVAFDLLRRACHERTVVSLSLKVDPVFDALRPDPRFADLLRLIGVDRYARAERAPSNTVLTSEAEPR